MIHKPGMPGLKFEQRAYDTLRLIKWYVLLQMGQHGGNGNWHNSLPAHSCPDQDRSAFAAISMSLGRLRIDLNRVPHAQWNPRSKHKPADLSCGGIPSKFPEPYRSQLFSLNWLRVQRVVLNECFRLTKSVPPWVYKAIQFGRVYGNRSPVIVAESAFDQSRMASGLGGIDAARAMAAGMVSRTFPGTVQFWPARRGQPDGRTAEPDDGPGPAGPGDATDVPGGGDGR